MAPHKYAPKNNAQRNRRRGSAIIEMTMIGIPVIFVLISIFEMARGMWIYHSLAFGIKEGARFASVHGVNCTTSPNACPIQVSDIAAKIRDSALGLDPNLMQVRLCSNCGTNAAGSVSDDTGLQTLTTLLGRTTTQWPGSAGVSDNPHTRFMFTAQYPFNSALAMLAPMGGGPVKFGTFVLVATAGETIHF